MALSDPQSVTIDGTAHSCALISREGGRSLYRTADQKVELEIIHTSSSRRRRDSERVNVKYTVTDPVTGLVREETTSVTTITDRPLVGRPIADDVKQGLGLAAFVSASTGATHTRVLAGES